MDGRTLSNDVSTRLIYLPMHLHVQVGGGELQRIYDRMTGAHWQIINSFFLRILLPFLTLLSMVVLGFLTNPTVTLVCLVPLPFSLYLLNRFSDKIIQKQLEANNLWDGILLRILDALTNIKVIKLFHRYHVEIENFKKMYSHAMNEQIYINKFWAVTESASEGVQF